MQCKCGGSAIAFPADPHPGARRCAACGRVHRPPARAPDRGDLERELRALNDQIDREYRRGHRRHRRETLYRLIDRQAALCKQYHATPGA